MSSSALHLTPGVQLAFTNLIADKSLLAVPFLLVDSGLRALPPIHAHSSFQSALNELDLVLGASTSMYILLRRKNIVIAITYVPYLAQHSQRQWFLEHRHELVKQLGVAQFSQSLVCKERGEITDARSWEERDGGGATSKVAKNGVKCNESGCENCGVEDMGYKQNKCRLCDRRMKNKIAPEVLEGLKTLDTAGTMVQVSVDVRTETLVLNFALPDVTPETVADTLPIDAPSFTFYRHATNHLLHFIFHSPDTATVQARMKHTVAISGLLVHAEDLGVSVDQKIEIHELGDLVFEDRRGGDGDRGVAKFRSLYERNAFTGTELMYTSMEADKKFLDAV